MAFCSQFKALLKKNFILWHRNLCGSICEILLPGILMFLVVLLKFLIADEEVSGQSYLQTPGTSYYFDDSMVIGPHPNDNPGMKLGLHPGSPFSSCVDLKRPLIAFVGENNDLYDELRNTLFGSSGGKYFDLPQIVLTNNPSLDFKLVHFSSEEELEDYVTEKEYDSSAKPGICAGIVITGQPGDWGIKLRFDDDSYEGELEGNQIPTTRNPIVDTIIKYQCGLLLQNRVPNIETFRKYHESGFTFLQYLITRAILRTKNPAAQLTVGFVPMKTREYTKKMFLANAGQMVGLFLVVCYLAPIFRTISMIVQDKELKTREGMKMMGLKDSAYWASFIVYYFVIYTAIAALLTLILVTFIYEYSEWYLIFLLNLLYGLSVFSFSLLISSFFYKARVAGMAGALGYFFTYVFAFMVQNPGVSEISKNFASLIPSVSICLGTITISKYEMGQQGLSFDNITNLADNYRVSTTFIMLAVSSVVYGLLGLYLDNVIPSPTGARKPLLFFLNKEFWSEEQGITNSRQMESEKADDEKLYPNDHFAKVTEELKAQERNNECLKIRHLHKAFGLKQVVTDLSVNMYKGQIFALLGPNGAGKTTTISMLAGLLPPTSGSASFSGLSIFEQVSRIREKLGVCPQHDVLFEKLTPREHLEIFASFKGRSDSQQIQTDVEEILQDIDLKDVEDMVVCNLSGGQTRKLSIGISFIGKSEMIFLDEPTSGIDLAARKKVWAMLKKYKSDKVIILTTHYMEEAEELGDRIGIMSHGTLKCVGDPLFLNSVYGVGYNLVIVKEDPEDQEVQKEITAFLKSKIEGIKLRRDTGKEITYFLPKEQAGHFKEFFLVLDSNLSRLKIQSYGMTTNTLEEVFLKVASGEADTQGQRFMPYSQSESIHYTTDALDTYSIANEPEKSCFSSFCTDFSAIIMKRLYITLRNWPTLAVDILFPIAIIVLGFVITQIRFFYDGDTRWLTVNQYSLPQSVYINSNKINGGISVDDYTKYFEPGMVPVKYTVTENIDIDILKEMEGALFADHDTANRYGSIYLKSMDNANNIYEYVVFGNTLSQDSAGAFMGFFSQALLRTATGDSNLKVTYANYPLPLTYETRHMENTKNGEVVYQILSLALALVPASIVAFVVKEREDNLKHQQIISGISLFSYWTSNACFDLIRSLIPASAGIGMIYAFSIDMPNVWVLVLIFAIILIPFTYASSFLFENENVAQTVTLVFHFSMGMLFVPTLEGLRYGSSTKNVAKILAWIFRVVPTFSLANGISSMAKYFQTLHIHYSKQVYAAMDNTDVPDDFDFDCAGGDLLFLIIGFPLFIALVFIFESSIFSCFTNCCEPKYFSPVQIYPQNSTGQRPEPHSEKG
eukprot:TRINITY_DN88309_c0_g1_i1.p1 TRINITY_DN88309_c0_g1~~TRINITY_DN88309_c0_g1_i1.p1  ORF type:complete len:1355 (+),score=109.74 TRINITY_DN88309_c0_g1_i1:227-4291(+)